MYQYLPVFLEIFTQLTAAILGLNNLGCCKTLKMTGKVSLRLIILGKNPINRFLWKFSYGRAFWPQILPNSGPCAASAFNSR